MSSNEQKIYTYLGFAAKSKKAKAGEQAALAFLKKNEVYLLVISESAQEKAIQRWKRRAAQYEVPYLIFGTQEELGKAIGSSYKTVIALTDQKLAAAILSHSGGALWEKSESTN
ncbi:MAG: ribosomal L7Ae/L30e/S12e/Gadd45 family protein [Peptococcaceae bacterium]|nr:ribosomal L7Ae/L30e/S12e/Gadd45 family protein [Peptococcaceae bacterium]